MITGSVKRHIIHSEKKRYKEHHRDTNTDAVVISQRGILATMSGKEVIRAAQMFSKTGMASKVSVGKEIAIGLGLGISLGMVWQV